MEILAAIRFSSEENGAPVYFPLRPTIHKFRQVSKAVVSKVRGRIGKQL